ncbi:MAG: 2OG-Fe(II) oxygenase [Cyanobacteriota bacterium]|nr:2OG-Fe(II) oxygenase [Cyanobacteriota bacterium]
MQLICPLRHPGYEALADAVMAFFDRRPDLHRRGVAFGGDGDDPRGPAKVSTDITLVAPDRDDPEAQGLAEALLRGVTAGLGQMLRDRPLLQEVCPGGELFVVPLLNLQRYAPGEGFHRWHADWTTDDDVTEPVRRVLAWILYCDTVPDAGTEFHWQGHHEEAERGKLLLFPAGVSHVHRGRVSHQHSKTIATGWINAGRRDDWHGRLRAETAR